MTMRGLGKLAGVAACVFLTGMYAQADVLDISSDGTITRHDSAGVYSPGGTQPGGPSPMAAPDRQIVGSLIDGAAQRHAIDPQLMRAVAWQESRFHHEAVSPKGAIGIMQLMPDTARMLGVDPRDIAQNVEGGAVYLRQMLDRYHGDTALALAAYNAGPGSVDRRGAIPAYPETRAYVQSILAITPSIQPATSTVLLINR